MRPASFSCVSASAVAPNSATSTQHRSSTVVTSLEDLATATASSFHDFAHATLTQLSTLPRTAASNMFEVAHASVDALLARRERIEHLAAAGLGPCTVAIAITAATSIGLSMMTTQAPCSWASTCPTIPID
ncbi:hypothetical protein [Xylophilus sp. GOD-11R]|uniref:hypothetical protein n=1 Tax=Xylophilus sp. GOD-11R TaxID=3089814 RepID=UPI00298C1CFA|nr:hypothetical protein [Xylophilus sp. GOD-11R]WPB57572.1 hypothetical protein R9X41_02625 [Xylophilus sp. GOD-11R]